MKKICLFLLAIGLSLNLSAQNSIDILSIVGQYGFPQSYETQYTEEATEIGCNVGLTLPVVFSETSILFNNINYYYFQVNNNITMDDSIANPIELHGFVLRTGLVQKFSDNRAVLLFFMPRYMTDFNETDESRFQLGGMAMYEKRYSDNLMMRFGAMFNNEFFGPYLVPLIHVDWQLSSKWSIVGMLPVYLKVNYRINERLVVGFSHFGLTTSYRLGKEGYSGDYLTRQSIDLSLYGHYNIVGNLHIEGRIGLATGRDYAQYKTGQKVDFSLPLVNIGDDRIQKNYSFNNGAFVNLRLIYSIPLDEK